MGEILGGTNEFEAKVFLPSTFSWGFCCSWSEDGVEIQGLCHQDNHKKTEGPISDFCGSQTWKIFSPPVQWDYDESLHYSETYRQSGQGALVVLEKSKTLTGGHFQFYTYTPQSLKSGKSSEMCLDIIILWIIS